MKSFVFNLLPKKSKQEEVREQDRDKSSVYTAILPLVAVSAWLGLTLFNGIVVNKIRDNWQLAVDAKQKIIDVDYKPVRIQHGELVAKTQALEQVIVRDIRPEEVFKLTETLFPTKEAGVIISGYGRERDGSFNVSIEVPDYRKFSEIVRRFSNYDGINEVNIRSIRINEINNSVEGSVNFFFVDTTNSSI